MSEHGALTEPVAGRVVRLVPVVVFGSDCDHPAHPEPVPTTYGLMDAIPAWSDCNRAFGRIFRVDDIPNREYSNPDDLIEVWVSEETYQRITTQTWGGQSQPTPTGERVPPPPPPGWYKTATGDTTWWTGVAWSTAGIAAPSAAQVAK